MLPVKVLRFLQPRALLQPVTVNVTVRCARPGAAALSVCMLRGLKQMHVGRRSFLLPDNKVTFLCSSARCVSSETASTDGRLVYTGNLGKAVRGVKMFSYSSSGASLLLMPHIFLQSDLAAQSIALQVCFCGIIGSFTFLTPVLLHLVTKGYVARLYHRADTDTYTAITYSVLLTEKKNIFHQSQVRIPAVSRMFTTCYAGKTGLLVNPDLFPLPQDYNHLMGYDKPFSFQPEDLDHPKDC